MLGGGDGGDGGGGSNGSVWEYPFFFSGQVFRQACASGLRGLPTQRYSYCLEFELSGQRSGSLKIRYPWRISFLLSHSFFSMWPLTAVHLSNPFMGQPQKDFFHFAIIIIIIIIIIIFLGLHVVRV